MEQDLSVQVVIDQLMKLSVTTDMFNYSTKAGLDDKLALFKKHGFDYIHWCDNWNDDVFYSKHEMKEYAKMIKDHGLVCLDVHGTATRKYSIDAFDPASWKMYVKLLENRVQFCHFTGGDSVVVHPPKVHKSNYEKRVFVSRKSLESVKGLCLDLGVTLAIENCSRGDHALLSSYFNLYEPEFVGWCYDSGHANIHGNFDHLMYFGERLKVTHFHDNLSILDDHQYPGWGNLNWEKVSTWIKTLSYSKPLNLEVTHNPLLFKGSMDEFLAKTYESAKHF